MKQNAYLRNFYSVGNCRACGTDIRTLERQGKLFCVCGNPLYPVKIEVTGMNTCKKCGSEAIKEKGKNLWHICCPICVILGVYDEDEDLAIRKWNAQNKR